MMEWPAPTVARYAIIYGEVRRFNWLPKFLKRWKWFRKTEPIAWVAFDDFR